jgi:hypothetical protein
VFMRQDVNSLFSISRLQRTNVYQQLQPLHWGKSNPSSSATKPKAVLELQKIALPLKANDCAVSLSQFYPNGSKNR